MTRHLPLLLADAGLIKLIFFAVVGLIYLVSHLINNAGKKARQLSPPRPRPNPGPRDEVTEFLRRAAERRAAKRPEAELVTAPPSGEGVAQHVRQHLDTAEFSRRAGSLAQVPRHVNEAIESHLQQVFDHQVGRLASQPTVTAEEPPAAPPPQAQFGLAAAGLLPLLADRDRLREAIILTEILRPPLERW